MQNEVTGHAEVGIRQSGALTTLTAAMKSSSTSQTINNQGMLRNILAPDASTARVMDVIVHLPENCCVRYQNFQFASDPSLDKLLSFYK
jgi:hypothetical protein